MPGAIHRQNLKPQLMRRVVAAWIYDYLICLWLATAVYTSINFLSNNTYQLPLRLQTLALLFFLLRDAVPGAGSLGKRLVGLTISRTSARSGEKSKRQSQDRAAKSEELEHKNGVSIRQSVLRNSVLLLPYFIYQAWAPFLPPSSADALSMGCSAVTLVIAILELIFMLTGERRRLADRLAGTAVTRAMCNEAR